MDWQPIETAPKDRRVILVATDGEVWAVRRNGDMWLAQADEESDGLYVCFDIADVTHWMPLPEPPK